jgi:hypothetical protein
VRQLTKIAPGLVGRLAVRQIAKIAPDQVELAGPTQSFEFPLAPPGPTAKIVARWAKRSDLAHTFAPYAGIVGRRLADVEDLLLAGRSSSSRSGWKGSF